MEKLTNDEFLSILNLALKDTNINNYEFRILSYIHFNNDFMISDLKKDLKISSFNMVSKFIKNLIEQNYILKISRGLKNQKNISTYQYFVNTEKLQLQKNINNIKNSPLSDIWDLYYYFFEKIPTSQKIDKFKNIKHIQLLIENDNYEISYIKKLIDFVSERQKFKDLCNRPISFRKNIKEIEKFYLSFSLNKKD